MTVEETDDYVFWFENPDWKRWGELSLEEKRNTPCPCESGLSFEGCHGDPRR